MKYQRSEGGYKADSLIDGIALRGFSGSGNGLVFPNFTLLGAVFSEAK